MIANTYNSISANNVITEQTISDLYPDKLNRPIKRKFALSSASMGGNVLICFTVEETAPNACYKRFDLEDVDSVTVADYVLKVSSGGYSACFAIEHEEPAPEPATEPAPEPAQEPTQVIV